MTMTSITNTPTVTMAMDTYTGELSSLSLFVEHTAEDLWLEVGFGVMDCKLDGRLVTVTVTCDSKFATVVVTTTVVDRVTVSVVVFVTTEFPTSPAVGASGSMLCSITAWQKQNLTQSLADLSLTIRTGTTRHPKIQTRIGFPMMYDNH